MMNTLTTQQILALPMPDNDANAVTIGDYFMCLAEQAWIQEEGFSGKRPFGNSGWQHEVYRALVENNAITGEFEDGYLEDYDGQTADQIIKDVLKLLRKLDWKTVTEYKEPEDWYVVLLGVNFMGEPELKDCFTTGFTEKVAKHKVEQRKLAAPTTNWVAIHLPNAS